MRLLNICFGFRSDVNAAPPAPPAPAPPPQARRATPLGDLFRGLAWGANKYAVLGSHESFQTAMAGIFQFAWLWSQSPPNQPQPLNTPDYLACKRMLNGTSLIAPTGAAGPDSATATALAPSPIAGTGYFGGAQGSDFCKNYVLAQEAAYFASQLDVEIDQRGIDRSYGLAATSLKVTLTSLAAIVAVPYALNKLAFLIDRITLDTNEWTGKMFRRAANWLGGFGAAGIGLGVAGAIYFKYEASKIKINGFDPLGLKTWDPVAYRHDLVKQSDYQRNSELAGWFVLSSTLFGVVAVPFALDRRSKWLIAQERADAAAAAAGRPRV